MASVSEDTDHTVLVNVQYMGTRYFAFIDLFVFPGNGGTLHLGTGHIASFRT